MADNEKKFIDLHNPTELDKNVGADGQVIKQSKVEGQEIALNSEEQGLMPRTPDIGDEIISDEKKDFIDGKPIDNLKVLVGGNSTKKKKLLSIIRETANKIGLNKADFNPDNKTEEIIDAGLGNVIHTVYSSETNNKLDKAA